MKSNLQKDIKKVLDLLTVMTDELRDDVIANMNESFEAMMSEDASLSGAIDSINKTIDCDARRYLQEKMTEAVKDVMNRYYSDFCA